MFKLEIKTDNDAFTSLSGVHECVRILRDVATKLENGHTHGPLIDYNGTKVGEFHLTN